jgi:internalin A
MKKKDRKSLRGGSGPTRLSALTNEIKRIIADAVKTGQTELSLSYKDLTEVPEDIRGLGFLEALILTHNNIREVPDWIRELPRLQSLDLSDNPIETVPDIPGLGLDWETYLRCGKALSPRHVRRLQIITGERQDEPIPVRDGWRLRGLAKELPDLKELWIGTRAILLQYPFRASPPESELWKLIQVLDQFCNLLKLTIWGIPLSEVPESIRGLKPLRYLALGGNDLHTLPRWMAELSELRSLTLACNNFNDLPIWLAELRALEDIDLSYSRLTRLPTVLFDLQALRTISIRKGPSPEGIKEIPARINELPNLLSLGIDDQPIETPPPEVVQQGLDAIKSYWRQQEEAGVDYLCEAKLLLIGEPGAGKTSLAKKIIDPSYKLQASEPSTEGIEVSKWAFPTALRLGPKGKEKMEEREFRVNIWDFGGQEIYHATHQFFLTRRSVYALVVDDRKEDTDFNYWLHIVELLSDASPLLIIQNEKQDRRRDINVASLRARFANLKSTCPTNLGTNRGLDELVAAIRQELEHLSHIGAPLPQTWKRVRETLEDDSRNYITQDEYLAICDQHGFKRHDDKLQLSGYLHDLGICLHFQDDPVLKNTVILKPRWGTAAVYRVLDDHEVMEHRGQFGTGDLKRIWSEEQFAPMRHELLRLMMRFELCYQLDKSTYSAPQLLSPSQPTYEWTEENTTVLRYEYDFMPKGLMTRLVVSLHHLIEKQALVWKTGAVFGRDGTRAEVVEDYPRRKITVRAGGPDVRSLLAILDDQLERIHGSFSRLQYEKFLPCNCEVCRKRPDPFSYPLKELKDFASTGDPIQCRYSRKLVNAADLIREIFPAALRNDRLVATPEPTEARQRPLAEVSKEVFVSYAWGGESSDVVDKLEEALGGQAITLLRDKNEIKYRDAIREFMKRIGQGKCIVVILSKKYLESKYCMFELNEIADQGDVRDRVFPIILKDANVLDGEGRLQYISYWEAKKAKLDSQMKKVGGENIRGIADELDQMARIRSTIDGLMDILADMNCLTPEQHEGSDFAELATALQKRLAT